VQVRKAFSVAVASIAACLWFPALAQSQLETGHSVVDAATPVELTEAAFDFDQQTTPSQMPVPAPVHGPVPSYPVPTPEQAPDTGVPPPRPATHRFPSLNAYDPDLVEEPGDRAGSVYLPIDNWTYPEMVRLYELGYVDTTFLGLRPWTRRSVLHMLERSQDEIMQGNSEEAKGILAAVLDEVSDEETSPGHPRQPIYGTESVYTRLMGVDGTALRDSYHLGQTISYDYGRPYEHGFNAIAGFSTVAEAGRFSFYFRGEYQHSPGAMGYSQALATELSEQDEIGPYAPPNAPQATIPAGPIAAQDPFRIVEATLSYHLLGHEISAGKSDAWLGPASGGAYAWSNNAENIYSFRIDRVEPLSIPLLSRLLGPFRYDFFYGSLKGHTDPNSPYVHSEAVSFEPTSNLQIGFQRAIIFGGQGHAPVNLHLFLKGFFGTSGVTEGEKFSRNDPGARFSTFNATYRLPLLRHYATFYVDSMVHDDVSPVDAPRRAAFRTGIDVSQLPGLRKLEVRVEAASTAPDVLQSAGGHFMYFEVVQVQGYTNKGYILGDSIGREAKGGQAWITYHLSPRDWIQVEYLNKKEPIDFNGGTTQNQFKATVVKRLKQDIEVNGWVQYEAWKAPIYLTGEHKDVTAALQVTWFLRLRSGDR
jgi:hypothetical protein